MEDDLPPGQWRTLAEYRHLPVTYLELHSPQALAVLRRHPRVTGLYRNRQWRLHLGESLPLVGQDQALAAGQDGSGTAVAVIDSGVDYRNKPLVPARGRESPRGAGLWRPGTRAS